MSDIPENKSETEKLYELGFHLVPTLSEEEVQEEFNGIKEAITKNGGSIKSESGPVLINLQYTMVKNVDSVNHKYETANFAWVKFNAEPEVIEKINDYLDLHATVLRSLLIKTLEGANVSAQDLALLVNGDQESKPKDEEKKEDEEVAEEVEEASIDEKAVDEAIDGLIEDNA